MENRGKRLFEKTTIAGMELRNRLVRSATWEGMCDSEGRPKLSLAALYGRLARGGVGLIVTGFTYVIDEGRPLPGCMGVQKDDFAAEMKALTQAVHREGGKLCMQLGHGGGQTTAALCGTRPLAPSGVSAQQYPEPPQAMTEEDVERTMEAFASAARRAKEYGFDAVQLHAAHGYLINQFLSPHTNLRQDAYGGGIDRRCLFLIEVYARVRAAVGPDFPVLVKLNASDNLEDGFTLEEALYVAKALDVAGISAIEVSGGTPASGKKTPLRKGLRPPAEEAYNLDLARAVKKAVKCPVMVVGGVRTREVAEAIIEGGESDYVSLCRPLVREPDLPRRWQRGEVAASCVSCNGCFKTALKGAISCPAGGAA